MTDYANSGEVDLLPTSCHGFPVPAAGMLFDLDGTLADSYQAIWTSVNHVRGHHGLAPLSQDAVRAAVGNGLRILVQKTVPAGTVDENSQLFLEHHPTVLEAGTRLLPHVRETIVSLSQRGCKLAVCSNKPLALTRRLLGILALDQYFTAILGPESAPRQKPAPDMLLEAIRQLDVPADRVLYVGDMTIDISAARAAGLRVWVIPTGSNDIDTLRADRPDHMMAEFRELLELVPVELGIGVGRDHWIDPLLPPNRTGGSPASGSLVDGLTPSRVDRPVDGPFPE